MSFYSIKIAHHFHGKSSKTNGAGVGPNQCCSGDSTKQMVVRLTSVIRVAMAMMMTMIAAAAAAATADARGRGRNTAWRKCVNACF